MSAKEGPASEGACNARLALTTSSASTPRTLAAGFEVRDLGTYVGTWPSAPCTRAALGLDATLFARRAATDDQIEIQIRFPEGFAATRLLQIHWRKISAAPEPPAGLGCKPRRRECSIKPPCKQQCEMEPYCKPFYAVVRLPSG